MNPDDKTTVGVAPVPVEEMLGQVIAFCIAEQEASEAMQAHLERLVLKVRTSAELPAVKPVPAAAPRGCMALLLGLIGW